MTLVQPLVVICFCKEITHLFMVSDQFSTLEQDCGSFLPVPIRDSQSASVFRPQVKALFLSHYMED